jgi:hypothetical protein
MCSEAALEEDEAGPGWVPTTRTGRTAKKLYHAIDQRLSGSVIPQEEEEEVDAGEEWRWRSKKHVKNRIYY